MPVFLWEGQTRKGEKKKGEIEAANEAALRGILRRQGLTSITVKQKPKNLSEYLPFLKQKVKENTKNRLAKLSPEELAQMSSALETLRNIVVKL